MKYAHKLNISTEGALKVDLDQFFAKHKEYDLEHYVKEGVAQVPFHLWMNASKDIFHEEWLEKVQQALPPEVELRDFTMFFYRPGQVDTHHIHADVAPYDPPMVCVFALNFTTIEADPTEMIWYERLTGEQYDPYKKITYADVPREEVRELGRAKIGSKALTLVSTSHLHDVDNKGMPRWCLSLRTNMPYASWEEAEKAFKHLFVDE